MIEVKKRKTSSIPVMTCFDVYVTRGDSAYLDIDLKDGSGQPLILGDEDVVRCQVRNVPNTGKLLFEGHLVKNEGSSYTWQIRPEDTKDAPADNYVWDAEVEYYTGEIFTFIPAQSKFVILPEVTYDEENDEEDNNNG